MLDRYEKILKCELCGGDLVFSSDSTVDEYVAFTSITEHNLHNTVEELLNDYLVYVCVGCGQRHKYTTKQIEYLIRKSLTKRALLLLVNNMVSNDIIIFDKYLIYCGKCQGLDGKGSCPKSIYNPCKIKRFPVNECL